MMKIDGKLQNTEWEDALVSGNKFIDFSKFKLLKNCA